MIVVIVVCVALCLDSRFPCVGYVSGDFNLFPPVVRFQPCIFFNFISKIHTKK